VRSTGLCSGISEFFCVAFISLIVTSSAWATTTHEKVLHNFVYLPQGAYPKTNLIADAAGNLYGTTYGGGRFEYGAIFKLTPAKNGKWNETVLYSFAGGTDGADPSGNLVFDAAGNLYGTTTQGGNGCTYNECGTVFMLAPGARDTWTEKVLHVFTGYPDDGQVPAAGLIIDGAGNLYGTTEEGGSYGWGIVFELSPQVRGGWAETILHGFTHGADGAYPVASLIFDSAGNLYGTTEYGGDPTCDLNSNDPSCGTVFELTPNDGGSWSETVLHTFIYTDGAYPTASLVFDATGDLYGTTTAGPGVACNISGCGTVYRLHPNSDGSWTQAMIYNFEGGPDGVDPVAGLVIDSAGHLYGTTQHGGSDSCDEGCGTVFELTARSKGSWTEKVIQRFSVPTDGKNDGIYPVSGLFLDRAGNLFGTAVYGGSQSCYDFVGCGTVFELSPSSGGKWTTSLLYAFNTSSFGASPAAGLISDGSGNLYGTTQSGGTANYGVAFELTPKTGGGWNEIVLHNFVGGSDGSHPGASLIFDAAGNLYGTTTNGGTQDCSFYSLCGGTVFELSRTDNGWRENVIHRFGSNNNLGLVVPMAGLVLDSAGNLYGATPEGGSPNCGSYGCGMVYKLSREGGGKWKKDVLYLFQGGSDGSDPLSTLIFDQAGNLYGTTCVGGANENGTVFKLAPEAGGKWKESVLYSFQGSQKDDGSCPLAGVIFDREGNLYGTTYEGGNDPTCDCGVVFELLPTGDLWKEKVLHSFHGLLDGSLPKSSLAIDEEGDLYGATPNDGVYNQGGGAVFRLIPGSGGTWTMNIVHHFKYGSKGGFCPVGPLIFDLANNTYGAASCGGTDGSGTVFELSAGSDGDWFDNNLATAPPGFRPPRFKPDVSSLTRLVRNAPQGEVNDEK
jgi:uncharacterized repeat protein (TIGR03803 family)